MKRELAASGGELVGPEAGRPRAAAPAGGGQALPKPLQAKMEASFGADFSSVRVHEDAQAGALGAQAFARGDDLHFQPGRYEPSSTAGQELIGHELAHVVQQRAGRVATPQGKGGINADASLEAEADEQGARAARGEPAGARAGGAAALESRADGEPVQLRKELTPQMLSELQRGAKGGWRWVSNGEPHVTVFIEQGSASALDQLIKEERVRLNGLNRLKVEMVPADTKLFYSEFHVTIARERHYYYDDNGTPLAKGEYGSSPPFTVPEWGKANEEAAKFVGRNRYELNKLVNNFGGRLPDSEEAAQQRLANAQRLSGMTPKSIVPRVLRPRAALPLPRISLAPNKQTHEPADRSQRETTAEVTPDSLSSEASKKRSGIERAPDAAVESSNASEPSTDPLPSEANGSQRETTTEVTPDPLSSEASKKRSRIERAPDAAVESSNASEPSNATEPSNVTDPPQPTGSDAVG